MSQQEKIPQGWIEVSLGDVIELKYGKALPAKIRDGEHFPVYGSNGIVGYHSKPIVNGPALVVGRKGSIGEVHLSEEDCSPIDTTYFVDEFHGQPPSFWLHRLRCLNLADLNRATALPGLNRNDAYQLTLLLPPLKEQYRIVEKTEALQARSSKARMALEAIPPLLEKFRQSVLSSAFRGDLTADWRAQNPDIEPAEKLLERIRKERRKRWEENELAKMKAKGLPAPKDDVWWLYVLLCENDSFYIGVTKNLSRRWTEHATGKGAEWAKKHKPTSIIHHEAFHLQEEAYNREKKLKTGFGRKWLKREYAKGTLRQAGKTPKDDKWKDKYKEPEPVDTTDLPELPVGWCWGPLEILGIHQSGIAYKSKDFADSGIQVVKLGNLYQGRFDLSRDPTFIPQDHPVISDGLLQPGDLIISQTGTRFKRDYGNFVIIPDDAGELVLNQRLLRVRLVESSLAKWVLYTTRLVYYRDYFFSRETGGVNQGNVGVEGVMRGPIPFAPYQEMKVILRQLEDLTKYTENIETISIKEIRNLSQLDQSILSKAFRGELVPQDPNDEPASVLLERIKQEKTSLESRKKKRARRGRTTKRL